MVEGSFSLVSEKLVGRGEVNHADTTVTNMTPFMSFRVILVIE